jgi:hypothetical protein
MDTWALLFIMELYMPFLKCVAFAVLFFYIADYGNSRVRKVTAAGVISAVAGNGTSGYTGDGCYIAEFILIRVGAVTKTTPSFYDETRAPADFGH